MAQQLRRLEASILKADEGRLYDSETKRSVRAFHLGAPVNLEVDIRETAVGTDKFYQRLSIAVNSVINNFHLERPGDAEAYVHGKERPSYAEGYVWVPVQFYKLGRK